MDLKSPQKPQASAPREPTQDAIAMLKAEHVAVRRLLTELNGTSVGFPARRTGLLTEIATALRSHSRIEEKVFYPAYAAASALADDQKRYYEALEEHHVADLVLTECEAADASSDAFAGKAKVLKDIIEHHADEEEQEIFPRMQALLSKDALQELGEQMRTLKAQPEDALSAGTERLGPMEGHVAMHNSPIQQIAASSQQGPMMG